jgi:hypothetical protein
MLDRDAKDRRHNQSMHAAQHNDPFAVDRGAPRSDLTRRKRRRGVVRSPKAAATQPCPVRAAALLSAAVRTKGPDHAEALAAAGALLAACEGITDDADERRCEPFWREVAEEPPPGAWCACCGERNKRGVRWWRLRAEPRGWACAYCHPPRDHSPEEKVVVET